MIVRILGEVVGPWLKSRVGWTWKKHMIMFFATCLSSNAEDGIWWSMGELVDVLCFVVVIK